MAEKGKPAFPFGTKPVPMKLFATWEVDRTPPSCVPRLCNLTLSRLSLLQALGPDITSIVLAVKMQSSRRILRSNEILVPNGPMLLDTELELTFALQYPHFLKREGNRLLIMLQRRKRYKNRAILGFKTLAAGTIDMSQVLQKPMDMELELIADGGKPVGDTLAKVYVHALCSQPSDGTTPSFRSKGFVYDNQGSAGEREGEESEDEEDFSSPEEGSDSEPTAEEASRDRGVGGNGAPGSSGRIHRRKGTSKGGLARQRNLKQKFVALLKRFRVNEDLQNVFAGAGQKYTEDEVVDDADIADLIDELAVDEEESDDLSDDGDGTSVSSTPKPSLRPFFSSSRSLSLQESRNLQSEELESGEKGKLSDESSKKNTGGESGDSHPENWTDPETSEPVVGSSPPKIPPASTSLAVIPVNLHNTALSEDKKSFKDKGLSEILGSTKLFPQKEKKSKPKVTEKSSQEHPSQEYPRKVVLEQLARLLPASDDGTLPEITLLLVNTQDPQGARLASLLTESLSQTSSKQLRVVCTAGLADVKAVFTALVSRVQKFCNTNAKAPHAVTVGIIGSNAHVNAILRPYVETMANKPPDWCGYFRFLIMPLGSNAVCRFLCSVDGVYNQMFGIDSLWREVMERDELRKGEGNRLASAVAHYAESAKYIYPCMVAEAMLTYKAKTAGGDSTQAFVPFVYGVKVLLPESIPPSFAGDQDEGHGYHFTQPSNDSPSTSNANTNNFLDVSNSKAGWDNTPPSSPNMSTGSASGSTTPGSGPELLDLQLEYWIRGKQEKCSLKSGFKSLTIQRLNSSECEMTLIYTLKEKKQKTHIPDMIQRLGKKKDKFPEPEVTRTVTVEGINRLVCLSRSPHFPMKVTIDGVEWPGVKFFQLSSSWQTQVRYFPVSTIANVCVPNEK
ncbi:unnamed protein product [Cyprideis torosa]|uniref:Uncharacterized protein n=1 Tax=Cyprideis torosa TaxID=163714 RepID=A0A7R8ZLA1_9CRUS|nr:unnamed protein product [Cyprideis torosa]CAG0886156.1 unnamed protein product [Cyprideis torosa]